jgi:hypothetical protein
VGACSAGDLYDEHLRKSADGRSFLLGLRLDGWAPGAVSIL